MSVCSENAAYNQPPEPGIYIGPGMTLPEAKPAIKYYDGTNVSSDLKPVHAFSQTPVNAAMKVFGNRTMALPVQFNGMLKQVSVYDYSGKLVHKSIVKKDNINVQKDFGLSSGLYLLHVNGIAAGERD
jgi:hypothetical protein